MFLLAVITTVSKAINAGFTASGVAVEKSAMTAPMVTTESKLALTAVAADSVRERMLKERFMIFPWRVGWFVGRRVVAME